ncbi:MAG: hypothetical protein V2J19_10915 [Wenzhouxiangella sp.]|jgi:hypothetical protein|nr:hypothetical protein [Wenzhouxiangella sp.]
MAQVIEKSGTGIGRSGTGIEKSGTGIEKSGTGIEKSGTGIARLSVMFVALATMMLSGIAFASDTRLAVSSKNGHAIVSVHGDEGVMIGVSPAAIDAAGYARVPLYSVLQSGEDAFSMGLLVQGSGSGSAGESDPGNDSSTLVQGSGSGSSKESVQPGGQLMVQGSGSGSAGERCSGGSSMQVQGSGSGSAGEGCSGAPTLMVQGSGSGSAGENCSGAPTLMVQGSGSGSAGEAAGCGVRPWGYAEVVVDRDGTHVIVNRLEQSGAVEYLMAFLPSASGAAVSGSLRGGQERGTHEFVAVQ